MTILSIYLTQSPKALLGNLSEGCVCASEETALCHVCIRGRYVLFAMLTIIL